MNPSPAPVTWYREPIVWLLIALPLSAVVAGFATLWLALRSDDGLVVDDYYRRGVEINRTLDRDRAAAARGIAARVQFDDARRGAQIELNLPIGQGPQKLEVQLLHATRAGYDRRIVTARATDGAYHVALIGLVPGRYHIELAADDWRLLGSLRIPEDMRLELVPVAGLAAHSGTPD